MPVYHGIKTIFIRVPKTASTSISSSLHFINVVNGGEHQEESKHEGIIDIRSYLNKRCFDAYHKVAFVRNPWDWIVSCYFYYKSINKGGKRNVSDLSFEDFIGLVEESSKECCLPGPNLSQIDHPYQPQYKYLVDEDEKLIVDFVGKYEDIENEWDRISEKIGIKNSTFHSALSETNTSSHKNYKEYYTDELKELVGCLYRKDIEMFDYRFK